MLNPKERALQNEELAYGVVGQSLLDEDSISTNKIRPLPDEIRDVAFKHLILPLYTGPKYPEGIAKGKMLAFVWGIVPGK